MRVNTYVTLFEPEKNSTMTNKEVAKILKDIAVAYTIKNENRFKIIAYQNAAQSIETETREVENLWKEGKLSEVPGIGSSLASHLDELFKTGKVKYFEDILKGVPEAVFPLLEIPGFGAKKSIKLVTTLDLKSAKTAVEDLEKAAKDGKIASIEGFGEKSEKDILESIALFRSLGGRERRMPLPQAGELAESIVEHLKKNKNVEKIMTLGSLRRMVSTIGDVDLAVATTDPEGVTETFLTFPGITKVVEKGKGGATVLLGNSEHVDMRIIEPQKWGSMLQYFTGSKNHNIKLREYGLKKQYSLNEYGIKNVKTEKLNTFSSEEKFYEFLGLPWIPPELREDHGEIEAAESGKLPKLIELKDIKSDLQIHSSFPIEPSHDLGKDSMEDIVKKAQSLGYEYIAFTEHNPSISTHNEQQIVEIMKKRKDKIEQLKDSTKSVRILNLLEIDILADGNLALPEKAFDYIDAGLASIHSSFTKDSDEQTKRVLKGLSHPKIKIYAHPTGRLINKREGIKADFEEIFKYCKEKGIALEINAYPLRLDLPEELVFQAKKIGCKFSLGTDAHDLSGMDLMRYGVAMARRTWLEKHDILNAMEYNEIYSWLGKNN